MSGYDEATLRLAEIHGFETQWHDFIGRHRQVSLDTLRLLLRAEGVDTAVPGRRAGRCARTRAARTAGRRG